jgi:transposase
VAQHGDSGLDARRQRGGQARLNAEQCQHLLDLLSPGARAHGFRNELRTLSRIATVIERHCLTYCRSGVWHLMRRLQRSPQKPERRARKRDEPAISKWLTEDWALRKKSPA